MTVGGGTGELEEVYVGRAGGRGGKGESDVISFQLKTFLKEKRELEGNGV